MAGGAEQTPANPYIPRARNLAEQIGRLQQRWQTVGPKAINWELNNRGLELCSEALYHPNRGRKDKAYGLFPKGSLNLTYQHSQGEFLVRAGYDDDDDRYNDCDLERVLALCLEHQPLPIRNGIRGITKRGDIFVDRNKVFEEYDVVRRGRRLLVPALDNRDVTGLGIERKYYLELYRHLEIPVSSGSPVTSAKGLREFMARIPRLGSAKVDKDPELTWLDSHIDEVQTQYSGQWVAISNDGVAGHGEELSDALEGAEQHGVKQDQVVVFRVSKDPSQHWFFPARGPRTEEQIQHTLDILHQGQVHRADLPSDASEQPNNL